MKRILCLAAAMLMIGTTCRAEFSPAYEKLKNDYLNGENIGLTVQLRVEKAPRISDPALPPLQHFTDNFKLQTETQYVNGEGLSSLSVIQNEKPLFEILIQEKEGKVRTLFPGGGEAYETRQNQPSAAEALGESAPLWNLESLYSSPFPLTDDFYDVLEAGGAAVKEEKTSTAIKNVGKSAGFISYTLDGETLNQLYSQLTPFLQQVLYPFFPQRESREKVFQFLQSLTFSSDCRFKRMYDGEHQDLGLQFTGRAACRENDLRKVTLFCGGAADSGFYISLSMPAVKGNNTFKWTLGGTLESRENQNTLTADMDFSKKQDGESASFSLEGSLISERTADGENWTGKITCVTQDGITRTFRPDFVWREEGMQGTVRIEEKKNKKETGSYEILCTLGKMPVNVWPSHAEIVDVSVLSSEEMRNRLAEEQDFFKRAALSMMFTLEENERSILTHALHTDEWITAPSVPVLEYYVQSEWAVTEERDR